MDFHCQLGRFIPALASMGSNACSLSSLPASLRMDGDRRFDVFYAPFDYVNTSAKIVIVGTTPGQSQAFTAITTAARLLSIGRPPALLLRESKMAASFAGPIRSKLVLLLDHIGLPAKLGIGSTSELWGERSDLVHFTSALRYPVLDKGRNYTGSGLTAQPLLLNHVDKWFASECAGLPSALFLPLGNAAGEACDRMIAKGLLSRSRVLEGLPHPSPANSERVAYFLGRKPMRALSTKTNGKRLDQRREQLVAKIAVASF